MYVLLAMQLMNVRNAVVVVSRWYGGVHLGPDRFKHINNCARTVIQDTHIGLTVSTCARELELAVCAVHTRMWHHSICIIPIHRSYTNRKGIKTLRMVHAYVLYI